MQLPYPAPTDNEQEALALTLLKQLHGLPVSTARTVLQRAEFWLLASTRLDCRATDFVQAEQALTHAAP